MLERVEARGIFGNLFEFELMSEFLYFFSTPETLTVWNLGIKIRF